MQDPTPPSPRGDAHGGRGAEFAARCCSCCPVLLRPMLHKTVALEVPVSACIRSEPGESGKILRPVDVQGEARKANDSRRNAEAFRRSQMRIETVLTERQRHCVRRT